MGSIWPPGEQGEQGEQGQIPLTACFHFKCRQTSAACLEADQGSDQTRPALDHFHGEKIYPGGRNRGTEKDGLKSKPSAASALLFTHLRGAQVRDQLTLLQAGWAPEEPQEPFLWTGGGGGGAGRHVLLFLHVALRQRGSPICPGCSHIKQQPAAAPHGLQ